MTAFDRIACEYPLLDPRDQDREFVTRDGHISGEQKLVMFLLTTMGWPAWPRWSGARAGSPPSRTRPEAMGRWRIERRCRLTSTA